MARDPMGGFLDMFTEAIKFGPAAICSQEGRGLGKKTLALRAAVERVFAEFDGSMSTRQVYYQLVSAGAVENRAAEYDRVQRVLVDMRRDQSLSYERIVDRGRRKHQAVGWDGVQDSMRALNEQYRRDLWAEQESVVMVAVEKAALEGIFAEVVDEYGASLWTLRGFISESFAFEWAIEIMQLTAKGKDVVVRYFGDFDPSGLSIEQDAKDKLTRHGARFEWARSGLLQEDFELFALINVPVKTSDSRTKQYLQEHGNRAAELDALRPDELRKRIRECIGEHIDRDAWERLERAEEAEKESLDRVSRNWAQALKAVS